MLVVIKTFSVIVTWALIFCSSLVHGHETVKGGRLFIDKQRHRGTALSPEPFNSSLTRTKFTRTLEATYYYTCPGQAMKVREFMWTATWVRRDGKVYVIGDQNIQFVTPLTIVSPNFSGVWVGTLCEEDALGVCTYVFTGKTEGSVHFDGIVINLVEWSRHEEDRPKVSVHCISRAAMENNYQCSAILMGENVRACTVNLVTVNVVRQ